MHYNIQYAVFTRLTYWLGGSKLGIADLDCLGHINLVIIGRSLLMESGDYQRCACFTYRVRL